MISYNKRRFRLIGGLIVFLVSINSQAKEPKAEIQQLKKQISQITLQIRQSEKQYTKENKKLFEFDAQIAKNISELRHLLAQQKIRQGEIQKAEDVQKSLNHEITKARKSHNELAKLFFMSYEKSFLKALFNEDEPGKIGRIPVYFKYIQQAYETSLTSLEHKILAQQANKRLLQDKLANLEVLLDANRTKSSELKSNRKARRQFLQQLDKQIADSKEQKQRLLKDQARLEKLAKELEALARKAKKSTSGMGFAKRKDGFAWPVEGKIIGHYGKPRISGGVKWRGLLIAAEAGNAVKVVASGRVIFADWLSSYGYVVIVDHGKDYLSLYGHNQQLRTRLGQKVASGDIIAEVGNSGRSGDPALYFEIRHKGKPVNPQAWLLAKKSSKKRK